MPFEKDDDSVISINSDSDDDQHDAPVTRSSSLAKRKVNRAYVELKSVASLRRTSSPASIDLEPRCKKRRLEKGNQEAEASTSNRPAGPLMVFACIPFRVAAYCAHSALVDQGQANWKETVGAHTRVLWL